MKVKKVKFLPTCAVTCLALAACGQPAQVERIDLDKAKEMSGPALTPSPDSEGASWTLEQGVMRIGFGKDPQTPYLSLACELSQDAEPRVKVIRHARADPGAKALFAVLGNNLTVRLNLDSQLSGGEWLWEGSYPARSSEIEAFAAGRPLEATLPGAGTLKLPASPMPGEFIAWCSSGGQALDPKASTTQIPD